MLTFNVAFCILWLLASVCAFRRSVIPPLQQVSAPLLLQHSTLADQQFELGRFAFSLVPLSPESVGRRKTIMEEVVKGKIWTFDQLQGVINVNGKYNVKRRIHEVLKLLDL